MKYIILSLSLFINLSFASNEFFGDKITSSKVVQSSDAIATMQNGQKVLINGTVDKVCKKKGCWMTLKSSIKDIRVTFKDYGFFVPLSLEGKKVLIEGTIEKKALTLKETKHLAEDAGIDPDTINKPSVEIRLIARGVKVI